MKNLALITVIITIGGGIGRKEGRMRLGVEEEVHREHTENPKEKGECIPSIDR